MKKITLSLLLLSALFGKMISQPIVSWNAPPNEQAGSNFALASGGNTAVYHRAAFLIKNSELAGLALTNSVITSVVFNYLQGINAATIGQFTLYLQNTADATYLKGTSWSTIITGMTSHYTGNYSIPVSNGTSATSLALSTTFAYTGGGIYVACNWQCPTANASQLAVVACNSSGLAGGAVRGEVGSAGPAPATLTVSAFRPSINLLAQNTATNELSVSDVKALGKNSKLAGFSEVITAVVKNSSIGALSNISVGLGITGANTFLNSQTIPSIAPGASLLVSFAAFTPTNNGINTIQVSTLPDQFPSNNSAVWSQSTTCNNVRIPSANLTASNFTSNANGAGASASGLIYAFSYTTGTSTSSLGGVNCVIPGFSNAANLGKQLYPVLCDDMGNIIATGSTLTIAANNMDVWNPMLFPTKPALMPNTAYLVGLGIPANAYFPIGNSPQNGVIGFYQVPITGGSPTAINYGNLAMEASLLFSSTTINAAANKTLVCKGSAITLSATGGATTFTWNSISSIIPSTNGIATVTPAITGLSGAVNYTVNGTATGGCTANKAVITISVSSSSPPCSGGVGLVVNGATVYDVKLSPNPSLNGKTTISGLVGVSTITVYNMLGQVVYSKLTNDETVLVNFENQPSGNYLIKITGDSNQTKTIKIVNQN